jgi:hypothetical protein
MAGVGAEPGVEDGLVRLMEMFSGVDDHAEYCQTRRSHEEREHDRADADRADRSLLQLAAEKEHDGRAEGRQQRDEPDVGEKTFSALA